MVLRTFFTTGLIPYLAVTCLFAWLAIGLLAFTRNRRNWLPRIGFCLAPVAALLVSWVLFGFLKMGMTAEYAACLDGSRATVSLQGPLPESSECSLVQKTRNRYGANERANESIYLSLVSS